MEFNPDDAPQYLKGVEYPATKEDLASAAESNGAPEELLGMIGSVPRPEFSSQEEVVNELRAFPTSG